MSEVRRNLLEEISIRGLGVIEAANVEFSPGLTVLTGETGAGKTMVLSALGLVLGSKSDADLVRKGAERTAVSAKFSLAPTTEESVLDAGGDVEDHSLVITRTVTPDGKSRILLGGSLSTTSKVSEIATSLIEIHGQSTNQRLSKAYVQREVLDAFANLAPTLDLYSHLFDSHKTLTKRINELRKESAEKESKIALLKLFVDDFKKLMPKVGELIEIDNDISRLGSVEELNTAISLTLNLLDSEDNSVVNQLQSARRSLEALKGKDAALDLLIEQYLNLLFSFSDLAGDLTTYLARLEADPARFDALQLRKAGINTLIKKYGKGSDRDQAFIEMITEFDSADESLKDLVGGDARIAELESDLSLVFKNLQSAARELSAARQVSSQTLSDSVTKELSALSMPHAKFVCQMSASDDTVISNFTPTGIDEVSFLFSGHKGAAALPLSKVASGGETSRVMLAIEVVIAAKNPVGTYIFDEIDAGVGGKAAIEVGRRLALLASKAQVIVVTHLAQVAVWADQHLVVRKDQSGSVTASDVISLGEEDRTVEIARMLSGQEESATAQEHASELILMVRESLRSLIS